MKLCECGCGQPAPIARQSNSKLGHVKGQPKRFLQGHHIRLQSHQGHMQKSRTHLRGASHYNWKGGRVLRHDGYVELLMPEHPNANSKGYVMEHVAIASAVLGRPLTDSEDVHHINLIRDDNRNDNLLICSHEFHAELHARLECYRAIGAPTTERPCLTCGTVIRPRLNYVKAGFGKYCSAGCSNRGRARVAGKDCVQC